MWLQRSSKTLNPLFHRLKPLSTAAAAAITTSDDPLSPPFYYLDGLPFPNPRHDETIVAIPRPKSGKNIAAKERKVGRVPSILFEQENGQEGGNKRLISVQTKQIKKLVDHLGRSFFLSRLFEVEVRSEDGEVLERIRALPRKVIFSFFFNF